MLIAISVNLERILPQKEILAFCPLCKNPVIAKMGKVKIFHWAHKEKSDCAHGRGMTEWHYRWIERHHKKADWEVEFLHGKQRFDCFNVKSKLVLEFQKSPTYEYIVNKTNEILSRGFTLKWVFHSEIFSGFENSGDSYKAKTFRRLVILDVLSYFWNEDRAQFYVDTLSLTHKGKSSKGLVLLKPKNEKYIDYYTVGYTQEKPTQQIAPA